MWIDLARGVSDVKGPPALGKSSAVTGGARAERVGIERSKREISMSESQAFLLRKLLTREGLVEKALQRVLSPTAMWGLGGRWLCSQFVSIAEVDKRRLSSAIHRRIACEQRRGLASDERASVRSGATKTSEAGLTWQSDRNGGGLPHRGTC